VARKKLRKPNGDPIPPRFLKFPKVVLFIKNCILGGLRSGVPAGWGVMVTEKAQFTMVNCRLEFTHQALGVVDWCKAVVRKSDFEEHGNALWFGNRCDVEMHNCAIKRTLVAFCLRTKWDRGTKCMEPEQDQDDGRRARLALYQCQIDAAAFEAGREPGTFINQSSWTIPLETFNASLIRPGLPLIPNPQEYWMKNTHRDDMSFIKTFGADPGLQRENPDFRPDKMPERETMYSRFKKYMAPADDEGQTDSTPNLPML